MSSYNRIILMGFLTRDVTMKNLPNGTSVAEFGIATNRKWKDKGGKEREEVMFIDCAAFSHTANSMNTHCKKGSPVLIEGRLTLDQWTGSQGQKYSKHKVTVDSYTFAGPKQTEQPGGERETGPTEADRTAWEQERARSAAPEDEF